MLLVDKARFRLLEQGDYSEEHHIVPRSLGGTDHTSNLVKLTAREHFVAHLLLTKFTSGIDKQKMFFALNRIMNAKNSKVTCSRIYQYIRQNHSTIMSKTTKLRDHNNSRRGKTYEEIYSPETASKLKDARSKSNRARIVSSETKAKISKAAREGTYNKQPKSDDFKARVSSTKLKRSAEKKALAPKYVWFHELHGKITASRYDLQNLHPDVDIGELGHVIRGTYRQHKGWRLKQ